MLKPIYDPAFAVTGWFDPTLDLAGWFDDELITVGVVPPIEPPIELVGSIDEFVEIPAKDWRKVDVELFALAYLMREQ